MMIPPGKKSAKIYDEEIRPIWSEAFGKLLLESIDIPPKSTILDVACGTGYPAAVLETRLDDSSRIIAIDKSTEMLDVARSNAQDLCGKRIFFKQESVEKLTFADDVFDLTVSNCGLSHFTEPLIALHECIRVTKPNCPVVFTTHLQGSFQEFFDLYREVLEAFDYFEVMKELDIHMASLMEPQDLIALFEEAGMGKVSVATTSFKLLFNNSKEFFFSPIIEYQFLREWKKITGGGDVMQHIFLNIKNSFDRYFEGKPFEILVVAGCAKGFKRGKEN